jgi:hypothetical protein
MARQTLSASGSTFEPAWSYLHHHHQCPLLAAVNSVNMQAVRLPVVGTLKRYSKTLEYEYRVKTAALGTLKRYSILSLTLYLE